MAEPRKLPDGTSMGSGTSYSTANVAGMAALWLSYHQQSYLDGVIREKNFRNMQHLFRTALKASAQVPPNEWHSDKYGAGIANAAILLQLDLQSLVSEEAEDYPNDWEILNQYGILDAVFNSPNDAFKKDHIKEIFETPRNSKVLSKQYVRQAWLLKSGNQSADSAPSIETLRLFYTEKASKSLLADWQSLEF